MKPLRTAFRNFEQALLVVTAAAGLTAVLNNLEFNLLEANLYDFRMAHGTQLPADHDIVLVTLDDMTVQALNEFSPLTLNYHARFMEAVEKLSPKAIGYMIDMNRVTENNPDMMRGDWGNRFVQAAHRIESKGTPVLLGTPFDVTGEVLPPFPLSTLNHSIAVVHRDGNVFSEDKITRRALTQLYDKPVFHTELAQRLGVLSPESKVKGSFYVPEIDARYFFFQYHGSTVLGAKGSELPYTRISFIDFLKGEVPAEKVQGKILLVGTLNKQDSSDYTYTPFSKNPFANPKIAVHATILDSVLHGNGIVRAPAWLNWATTFLITAFVLWWVLVSQPLNGVFVTLALAISFVISSQVIFSSESLWIRTAQPLVGLFLGYYLVVPYRLIREYKKRWDYQRKNQLLVQVEELKTNFLNLVTHDLKTPVARIQGLAEVLLRKASERLVDRDRETIQHIIESSDELNRFISSILELSKVESQQLMLNLESKDVNQIIERLVDGFKAQARAKQIKMVVELEPLFPIKADQNLISKVLSNLIDNAIKYSSPNSEVKIESREVGDFVEILVHDQGIGMNPLEIDNLFTRFYRAKNDTTSKVGGTGLGLYLTKYFIEAHFGSVDVESTPGKGSCFKIRLPLDASPEKHLSKTESDRPGLRKLNQKVGKLWNKEKANA